MAALTNAIDRGILAQAGGETSRFTLVRKAPADDLAEIVDRFWMVRWDLTGEPALEQETLPFPCVNMVIGDHRPGVHGPTTARFVARLEGGGWVLGTKFRPAGFRGMTARTKSPADLVDAALALAEVLGSEGAALERAVLAAAPEDPRAAIALVERFVRSRHAGVHDDDREANQIVEQVRVDAAITRVAELAARAGMPIRALERLFRARVGVSPKWVIRRFRVQEAAARLAAGDALDLAVLALDLGYFDQPHFNRDFKSQIGRTPAQYAKLCASRAR